MEKANKKATQEGAELAQAAREYANKVWLNFDKEYEKFSMSNKECGKLLPKDLLIWEVIRKAYEKGAEWMLEHPTGGELLHVCNKTAAITKREMIDKACEWLEENMEDYTEWFVYDEGECQHHAISSDYDYKKDFIKALRKAMEE